MSEYEKYPFLSKNGEKLEQGELPEKQFWLLTEISPIHSEKVINALRDHLVLGYGRKEACERHNVSLSYFSIAFKRMMHVSRIVSSLTSYYSGNEHLPERSVEYGY